MSTLNQYLTAFDYSQYYPAGAQYDATSGQYYDPQTGQYYDYSQYYQQYQAEKNTQSKFGMCARILTTDKTQTNKQKNK